MSNTNTSNEQTRSVNYFSDLYQFVRESTGIAITLAYLILILTSMSYLFVFYSQFNISIIKLVTIEDILVTPIKNPEIIFVYTAITFLFYLVDSANRLKERLNLKYQNVKKPIYVRVLNIIAWVPKSRKANIRMSVFVLIFSLVAYVISIASLEGSRIKNGEGYEIALMLAESNQPEIVTLLGTTSQFVIVFKPSTSQATAYQLESVAYFSPTLPATKASVKAK